MKKQISLLMIFCLATIAVSANVRLPNIIGSHMVLQKNTTVKIWGWASPMEEISIRVSWDTTLYKTSASNHAKWSVNVKTPDAGGPHSISIKGNNIVQLEDILIGEVWLCGGQSNMEWSGDQQLKQIIEEAPNANNTNIRFFYVPKATSIYPQEGIDSKWMVCTPEEVRHFSAIGYFFGKNLCATLNSPVGLINSNWGGTPAETWTPEAVVNGDAILKKGANVQTVAQWWPHEAALAYNAMIYPLTDYSIAGVIWYQGESNTKSHYSYAKLFTAMIDAWRRQWNINFPFYFVQIAPYSYKFKNIGALLREQQTNASLHPNTAMVVITDLVTDTGDIHPILKKEVAKRLSDLALKKTYGQKVGASESPVYASHKIVGDKINVQFNNASNGLLSKGTRITCFEIAGADKIFLPAEAKIEGNEIVVFNKNIHSPVAVRFAFSNTAVPNLFSKEGLPVNLFRTDDWEIDTSAIVK